MQIHYRKIEELKPADYNPRQMTEKEMKDLRKSLEKFKFVVPILVNQHPDRMNYIVGGHQRFFIAKDLGWKEIPVVYVNLPEAEEKELNLRLNKNQGSWNLDMLSSFEMDFLSEVGFNTNDLNLNVDKFDMKEEKKEAVDNLIECPECKHKFKK